MQAGFLRKIRGIEWIKNIFRVPEPPDFARRKQ
jgi:hypothetical protein